MRVQYAWHWVLTHVRRGCRSRAASGGRDVHEKVGKAGSRRNGYRYWRESSPRSRRLIELVLSTFTSPSHLPASLFLMHPAIPRMHCLSIHRSDSSSPCVRAFIYFLRFRPCLLSHVCSLSCRSLTILWLYVGSVVIDLLSGPTFISSSRRSRG